MQLNLQNDTNSLETPPEVSDTSVLRRADQTIFAMMQLPSREELVLKSFSHIFWGGLCNSQEHPMLTSKKWQHRHKKCGK